MFDAKCHCACMTVCLCESVCVNQPFLNACTSSQCTDVFTSACGSVTFMLTQFSVPSPISSSNVEE